MSADGQTKANDTYRQKMRDQGLVPKLVWIRDEYRAELKEVELRLREKK